MLSSGSLNGQALNPEYSKKLNRLYKYSVPLITPNDLGSMLEKPASKVVVLDTRSKEEYDVSHLPGAKFVDYDKFSKADMNGIPTDSEVIVYCSVGYRSERIGEKLQKMGYPKVKNLYGGIFEWVNEGHSVVDAAGKPTQKVHTYNADWGKWLDKGQKVF